MPDRSPEAHHQLRVDTRIGILHLRAQLRFAAPWTVLFGASGSGKSSLLRAISGLIPAAFERRTADQWQDLTRLRPHLRSLAYAPQRTSLLPHRTVRQNVAFPQEVRSRHGAEAVEQALDLFHLTALADRLPRALSGGEQQRVSLARAFAVPDPRLMLLDEPFTGVDRRLRDELLPKLVQHLADRGIPAVSVTHDIEEASLLNAQVVRIDSGTVVAEGRAHEILAEERSRALLNLSA